jgi:hypothetical protein
VPKAFSWPSAVANPQEPTSFCSIFLLSVKKVGGNNTRKYVFSSERDSISHNIFCRSFYLTWRMRRPGSFPAYPVLAASHLSNQHWKTRPFGNLRFVTSTVHFVVLRRLLFHPEREPFFSIEINFSVYCITTLTKAEWLQVRGETERGEPSRGWTCSASTPEGSEFFAHHSR